MSQSPGPPSGPPPGPPSGGNAGASQALVPQVQPAVPMTLTVGGRVFQTSQDVLLFLDSLTIENRIRFLGQAQAVLHQSSVNIEAIAHDLWNYMENNHQVQQYATRGQVQFRDEFHQLRVSAQRYRSRRDRLAETRRRLLTYMTEDFLRLIVEPLGLVNTTIFEALYSQRENFTPLQLLLRADGFRLQRWARIGPYTNYARGDDNITNADILNAGAIGVDAPPSHPQHLQGRMRQAAADRNFVRGHAGLYWPRNFNMRGSADDMNRAVQHGGRAAALPPLQPDQSGVRTLPNTPVRPPPAQPGTPPPDRDYNLRSNAPVDYYRDMRQLATLDRDLFGAPSAPTPPSRPGANITVEIPKRPRDSPSPSGPRTGSPSGATGSGSGPPAKRPGGAADPRALQRRPNHFRHPSDMVREINRLHTRANAMVAPELRETYRLAMRQIPVANATQLEQDIWKFVVLKAAAASEGRAIQISDAMAQNISRNLTLENLAGCIERLSAAVQQSAGDQNERTLRACYLDAIADTCHLVLTMEHRQGYPRMVREIVGQLLRLYRGSNGIFIPPQNPTGDNINLGTHDLESMIWDEQRSGWLGDLMIEALIRMLIARHPRPAGPGQAPPPEPFIIPSIPFTHWRTWDPAAGHPRPVVPLPYVPRSPLIFPLHWGNHWGLGTYDPTTHTIQIWDSHFGDQARNANLREGYQVIRNFLHEHRQALGLTQNQPPRDGTIRNQQIQRNASDCGIFVVEHARRFIEDNQDTDEDEIVPITSALRYWQAVEFQSWVINAHPPLDAAQVADAARQLRDLRVSQGGETRERPYSVRSTSTGSSTPPPPYSQYPPDVQPRVPSSHISIADSTPRGSPVASRVGSPVQAQGSPSSVVRMLNAQNNPPSPSGRGSPRPPPPGRNSPRPPPPGGNSPRHSPSGGNRG